MKGFIQDGDTIPLTAGDDTDHVGGAAGTGIKSGFLFGIAVNAYDAGETGVQCKTHGVFSVIKPGSQAWTLGAKLYWDDSALKFTTSSGGNTLVGHAVEAVGSGAGETTGKVRLIGYVT